MDTKRQMLLGRFLLKKFLGAGFEGNVYVACADGELRVLKAFHRPWSRHVARNLVAYSEQVGPNDAGFFPVKLIVDGDYVLGLHYEYMPLYRLPFRGRFSERITQALLAQYCYSQAYLLKNHSLYIVDDAMQFLLSEDGRFHYVDYGKRIVRCDDESYMDKGYAPFSFLETLLYLNGIALDRGLLQGGFDYHQPCRYVRPEQYDALVRSHPWTARIVEMCRGRRADVFLDHEFYQQVADMFARTIDHPRPLILADKLLFRGIRVLRMKRHASRLPISQPDGY